MRKLILIIIGIASLTLAINAQDPPSGYTVYYGFKMYNEGAYPTADSVNDNLVDIDLAIKNRDLRADSLRAALLKLHDWPDGTFNDTTWVFGTAGLGGVSGWLVGTYQGLPIYLATQGVRRLIIGGTGKITLGTTEGTGVEQLYSGGIQAKDSVKILGQYSGNIKFRQDSDENWLIYPSAAVSIIFGNTDASSWFTINAGGYQTQGTPGYLTSALGTLTAGSLWLSTTSGGATDRQLKYVTLTVNGVTRNFLVTDE